jgi:hypothetical protein
MLYTLYTRPAAPAGPDFALTPLPASGLLLAATTSYYQRGAEGLAGPRAARGPLLAAPGSSS